MTPITVESKHSELQSYLRGQCFRRNVPSDRVEDVVQAVLLRLLEKEATKAFVSSRGMWAAASILALEESARLFAGNLAVSGMGTSAHNAARKYLAASGGDVEAAYRNQTTTAKVSRETLRAVKGGGGHTDPTALTQKSDAFQAPDHAFDDAEQDVLDVFSRLSAPAREVVELRTGMVTGTREPYVEISRRMGLTQYEVFRIWKTAEAQLKAASM
jgi:DNA-directed RNA polymerase specialized sigma24 family protein